VSKGHIEKAKTGGKWVLVRDLNQEAIRFYLVLSGVTYACVVIAIIDQQVEWLPETLAVWIKAIGLLCTTLFGGVLLWAGLRLKKWKVFGWGALSALIAAAAWVCFIDW
jgi:hypothetical protein